MNAGSASSARKKSDPSVSNVEIAEHAAAVVKALRSATSSQVKQTEIILVRPHISFSVFDSEAVSKHGRECSRETSRVG